MRWLFSLLLCLPFAPQDLGNFAGSLDSDGNYSFAAALSPSGKEFIVVENIETADADTKASQGVATDGTYFYTAGGSGAAPAPNESLHKWTKSGDTYTLDTSRNTTSDWPTGMEQINSVHYHDGLLYVGGNNYNTTPEKGWVLVYDPSDLTHIQTLATADHWSEGGAWRYDATRGWEFWVCYADEFAADTYKVTRYEIDTWGTMGGLSYPTAWTGTDIELPISYASGTLFHEGLTWRGDLLFTMVHEGTSPILAEVYRYDSTGDDFVLVQQFRPPTDQCTQGLSLDPDGKRLWWAERFHGGGSAQDHRVIESYLAIASVPKGTPAANKDSSQYIDLIGWYPMNEGSGTSASEVVSDTHHGTLTGATWLEDEARHHVVDFDGTDDKVEISASLIASALTDFSVSGWFRVDAIGTQMILVSQNKTGSNAGDWQLDVQTDGTLQFYYDNATSLKTTKKVRVGEWFHVCATLQDDPLGGAAIYVNGQEWASNTTDGVVGGNSQVIRIGLQSNDDNDLNGKAHDIRFYDRAKSPAVVADMYHACSMFELWK